MGDDVRRRPGAVCYMTREEVEEDLETWRVVFERHGRTSSRTKTAHVANHTHETETRLMSTIGFDRVDEVEGSIRGNVQ